MMKFGIKGEELPDLWEFFLPEFVVLNDGSIELEIGCTSYDVAEKIVSDMAKEIAFNMNPLLVYNFHDLLSIFELYPVWSECNPNYEDERVLFMSKYRENIDSLFEKALRPSDYHSFLYKLFDGIVGERVKEFFDNFDSYFWNKSKNRKFEFKVSEDESIDVEFANFDEFKKKLIWICREKYPEASKSNNYILDSKTFLSDIRKTFIKCFNERLKKLLEKEVKEKKESLWPYIFDLKRKFVEKLFGVLIFSNTAELSWVQRNIKLLDEGNCTVFYEIESMLKLLHELNCRIESDDFLYEYLQVVFYGAMDKFSKSMRLKSVNNPRRFDVPLSKSTATVSGGMGAYSNINKVTSEEREYIKKIAELLKLDGKKRTEFVKYLTRLVANWRDIRVSVLEWQYWIMKLSNEVKNLFGLLSVEVIDNSASDEEWNIVEPVSDSDFNSNPVFGQDWWMKKSELLKEECENDPFALLCAFSSNYNYKIPNPRKLRKQINSICVDDRLKKLVCDLIKSEKFWQPDKKYSPKRVTFYSLRVWWNTWCTFLFSKDNIDWGLVLEWLYTHDDYIDRIKNSR